MNILDEMIFPKVDVIISEVNSGRADIEELLFYINDHHNTIIEKIEDTEKAIEFVLKNIYNKRLIYHHIYTYHIQTYKRTMDTFPPMVEPYLISDWRYFVHNSPDKKVAMGFILLFRNDKGLYKDALKMNYDIRK